MGGKGFRGLFAGAGRVVVGGSGWNGLAGGFGRVYVGGSGWSGPEMVGSTFILLAGVVIEEPPPIGKTGSVKVPGVGESPGMIWARYLRKLN
jgi:hypothetical protein